jgi:D-glycerate 3-kinase
MTASFETTLTGFLHAEGLPESYRQAALKWFLPLAEQWLERITESNSHTLVLGISGAQGTGKSTLARLLQLFLEDQGRRIARLSIDDFYFSRQHRQQLAATIHPLLATRGVPGTHDTVLALKTISALLSASGGTAICLPRFDKANDNPVATGDCPVFEGRPDLIILEGWFLGVAPQTDSELVMAVNELERVDDREGAWRRYANEQLATHYQTWFSYIDHLIVLQAPSFEQVKSWRKLQEVKLSAQAAKQSSDNSQIMNDEQLQRFIQHFERLTHHALQTLPDRADLVFALNAEHQIDHQRSKKIEA